MLSESTSSLSFSFFLAFMLMNPTHSTVATPNTLEVCELMASDESRITPYVCPDTKQQLKCPGEAVGFTCDFTAPFSQRNGDHYFCDFDVIDPHTVSVEEFRERYMFRKPVLINTTLADWSDPYLWTRAQLREDYNDFPFDAGKSLELVLNSGIGTTNSTLADYFQHYMKSRESFYPSRCKSSPSSYSNSTEEENDTNNTVYDYNRFDSAREPMYIFDRSIWREKEGFQFDYFRPLPYLHNNHYDDYGIFFIGVSGTGASFHGHGETWCGVAYGRKRWFLYPPEVSPPGGFWPGYGMLDWYDRIYKHLKDPIPPDPWMFNRNQVVRRKNVWTRKLNSTETNNVWKDFDGLWARKFNRYPTQELDTDSDIATIVQGDCRTKQDEIAEIEMIKRRDETDRLTTLYDDNYLHSEREYDFHQELLPPQQESHCIRNDHLYKPMECIQAEGQVIYVPEFWFHAVLNVGDVLAGAIQTSVSYSEWMELLDEVTLIEKDLDDQKRIKAHKKPLTDLEKHARHRRLLTIHSTMLRLAPNNAVHNFFVGYEYRVLEVYDKAIEHFSRAIRIDPTYIEAYLGLSDSYRYSKKYDDDNQNEDDASVSKAERVLRIAYRLNPLHPHLKNKLVDILQETGQFALIEKVQKSQPLPNIAESIPLRSKNRNKSRREAHPDINQIKPRGGY